MQHDDQWIFPSFSLSISAFLSLLHTHTQTHTIPHTLSSSLSHSRSQGGGRAAGRPRRRGLFFFFLKLVLPRWCAGRRIPF